MLHVLDQKLKQNRKMTLKDAVNSGKLPDLKRYAQDVRSEDFYPGIGEQMLKNKKKVSWEKLKEGVLAEVYFQRIKKNKHAIAKAFSELYPTVWDYIQQIKQNDHRVMAAMLMKKESNLMNRALKKLYKNYPTGLFLRLHDAIITTEEMKGVVELTMKEVGEEMIGFGPNVSDSQFNVSKDSVAGHDLSWAELYEQFIADQGSTATATDKRITKTANMRKITWEQKDHLHERLRSSMNGPAWEPKFMRLSVAVAVLP